MLNQCPNFHKNYTTDRINLPANEERIAGKINEKQTFMIRAIYETMSGKQEQSVNIRLDQYDLLSQRPALLQVRQALLMQKSW